MPALDTLVTKDKHKESSDKHGTVREEGYYIEEPTSNVDEAAKSFGTFNDVLSTTKPKEKGMFTTLETEPVGWHIDVKTARTIGLNGKIIIILSTHYTPKSVGSNAGSVGNTGNSSVP